MKGTYTPRELQKRTCSLSWVFRTTMLQPNKKLSRIRPPGWHSTPPALPPGAPSSGLRLPIPAHFLRLQRGTSLWHRQRIPSVLTTLARRALAINIQPLTSQNEESISYRWGYRVCPLATYGSRPECAAPSISRINGLWPLWTTNSRLMKTFVN